MKRSANGCSGQGQGHAHSYRSDALHSQVAGENGYHSELNHFSTGCLLML